MVRDLGDVDQAVHAGDNFRECAKRHEFDNAHFHNVAHAATAHEVAPRVAVVVLHTKRNLAPLRIIGDDVHFQRVAHFAHFARVLDAAPAQLGDMHHAVHAADVHEYAVRGHGLDRAGIVLAGLNVRPHFVLCLAPLLVQYGTDGTDNPAAGAVKFGDAQFDRLAAHLGQVRAAGASALGGGDKDADAVHGHHDAALFRDDAFLNGPLFHGPLHVFPLLLRVQPLLGQLRESLHIVHAHDIGLDLLADLDNVLRAGVGIVAQFAELDVGGLLRAHIHLHLRVGDGGDNAGDFLPRI